MEIINSILPEWHVYRAVYVGDIVYRVLDPPVAARRRQWKVGKERGVRTSEVMSEVNANNNEHRKDLQYEENSNDGSNDLFIVSRAALIDVSAALLTCSDKLKLVYCISDILRSAHFFHSAQTRRP